MTVTITTHISTYLPWEEEADEPELLSTVTNVDDVDPEDGMTLAELVAERLAAATEASVGGAALPFGVDTRTWYVVETYMHPYSGQREERSYHVSGDEWTDELAREVYALVGV